MSSPEEDLLYDILFELSNDIRHKILILLKDKPERVTQISQKMGLISPEVSRHLSRLSESRLIQKDIENYYHVTGYGLHILSLVEDMEFYTHNRGYFLSHDAQDIPAIYKKRLPELAEYHYVDNFMGFLNFINEKINEAMEFVGLCIDQYPIIAVDSLLNAVERGVKVRIIEQSGLSGPTVAFEDRHLLAIGDEFPDVIIKAHDRKDVYLFVSDVGSALSFPSGDGFDYSGFTVDDRQSGAWSEDLFNHHWENAEPKIPALSIPYVSGVEKKGRTITVEAHTDPVRNTQAIQNAIDNYDEVILRGKFSLAESKTRNAAMGTGTTVYQDKKKRCDTWRRQRRQHSYNKDSKK